MARADARAPLAWTVSAAHYLIVACTIFLVACGGSYRPVQRAVAPDDLEGVWSATADSLKTAAAIVPALRPVSPPSIRLRRDGSCEYHSFFGQLSTKVEWLLDLTPRCQWRIHTALPASPGDRQPDARYLRVWFSYPTPDSVAAAVLELIDTDGGIMLGQSTVNPNQFRSWILYARNGR